ncbi:Aminomethyltransferase folate-binding domain-containing protein [Violaceomyces palustris]|uniref:Aminomethyltransferase folate-binding domain-containing protein n=1 Tax=Violaceomyces palustris TaxID=1673888 RepID=A0ACD0P7W3_9BASI|nr:Aminomethyltransferase folate-binding domain-containing protein [Violaceomyces palustris]
MKNDDEVGDEDDDAPLSQINPQILKSTGRSLSNSAIRWFSSAPNRHQNHAVSILAAELTDRGLLEVDGKDTVRLLQGLVSNDVRHLSPGRALQTTLTLAAFSNPRGRLLAETLIHQLPSEGHPHILLDMDRSVLPIVQNHIKKFKLRTRVSIKDVSEQYIPMQFWREDGADLKLADFFSEGSSTPPGQVAIARDGRAPGMGLRIALKRDSALPFDLDFKIVSDDEYKIHRTLRGVPEGSVDFPPESSLPLEACIDYMNGIDYKKGCYIGQELTARTHHTGVVRKRIVPISLYEPGTRAPDKFAVDRKFSHTLPPPATSIRSSPLVTNPANSEASKRPMKEKSAGRFTQGIHNIGFAYLRLDQVRRWSDPQEAGGASPSLDGGLSMSVGIGESGKKLLVKPWIPDWWPENPVLKGETPGPSDED